MRTTQHIQLRLVHLYPQQLNIYGDHGNVVSILQRCRWREIAIEYHPVGLGDKLELRPGDIVFIGGGQDRGQQQVAADLRRHGAQLRKAVVGGMPALAICGGYQLWGHFFQPQEGKRLEGISVFDAETVAAEGRLVGNVVLESKHFGRLVGFENHSGRTTLADGQSELGVIDPGPGFGNNGVDSGEGAIAHNAIGTYLHGSFLPKNPVVADWLIRAALAQINAPQTLKPLDDSLEQQAATIAAQLES